MVNQLNIYKIPITIPVISLLANLLEFSILRFISGPISIIVLDLISPGASSDGKLTISLIFFINFLITLAIVLIIYYAIDTILLNYEIDSYIKIGLKRSLFLIWFLGLIGSYIGQLIILPLEFSFSSAFSVLLVATAAPLDEMLIMTIVFFKHNLVDT